MLVILFWFPFRVIFLSFVMQKENFDWITHYVLSCFFFYKRSNQYWISQKISNEFRFNLFIECSFFTFSYYCCFAPVSVQIMQLWLPNLGMAWGSQRIQLSSLICFLLQARSHAWLRFQISVGMIISKDSSYYVMDDIFLLFCSSIYSFLFCFVYIHYLQEWLDLLPKAHRYIYLSTLNGRFDYEDLKPNFQYNCYNMQVWGSVICI